MSHDFGLDGGINAMKKDYSYRTAIHRDRMSAPAQWLKDNGHLSGVGLDYGCGHGEDARRLKYAAYDPYFAPDRPTLNFDTILCTYVLNSIDHESVKEVLKDVNGLLRPGGKAFLTVRRDIKRTTTTSRGTTQRVIKLPLPIMKDCDGFCIYKMDKGSLG